MAFDAFLKIDGIPGEATSEKHKDEIQLISFSWGEQNVGAHAVGGGDGAGRVSMQDFHFSAHVSKASPKLFLACASGQHIASATLTVDRSSPNTDRGSQTFYKVNLSEVLVSSYQTGGSSGEELPTDQFSLNFAKIEITYTPQSATGQTQQPISAGWDLKTNKKV